MLSSTVVKSTYTGDDSTPTYDVGFWFEDEADLVVTLVTDGVEELLHLTSDYTVTGENTTTGQITLVAGNLGTGVVLWIERAQTKDQDISFRNQSAFFEEVHELNADRLVAMIQELSAQLAVLRPRQITGDPTSSATSGRVGEVVYSTDQHHYYGKHTTSKSDTNWVLLG